MSYDGLSMMQRHAQRAVRRSFFRCRDCFAVVAVDREVDGYGISTKDWRCDCGGAFLFMGDVSRGGTLRKTAIQSVCDERCTNAKGPSCDCMCGGQNHGSRAVVEVVISEEKIPTLRPAKPLAERAAIAAESRKMLDELDAAWPKWATGKRWEAHRDVYGKKSLAGRRKAFGAWIEEAKRFRAAHPDR